jgi:hypothetical protein
MVFFVLPGLCILAASAGYLYWKFVRSNVSYAAMLCSGLLFGRQRRKMERSGRRMLSGWKAISYEGIQQDRRILVEYRYRPIFQRNRVNHFTIGLIDELEVQIPVIQKFWLRMTPQTTESEERGEIQIDKELFDRAFRIFSNQREAAREFLQSSILQQKLRDLPIPFDRLEIHQGWLRVLFLQPREKGLRRSGFETILDHLVLLCVAYERQSYSVQVKMIEISSVCPYCREEMNQKDPIVECELCSTRLHKVCWDENRQCTTWGCDSRKARSKPQMNTDKHR